jgi:uncharacterized protein (TIGR02444 family)
MAADYTVPPAFCGVAGKDADEALRESNVERSLWNYAVENYRRPPVAAACLALQDNAGADINLLLTAAWLAARGCAWRCEDVERLTRLCADWRARCLLPLREVRRYLKETQARELYRELKKLELEAERRQLALLEAATAGFAPSPAGFDARALLSANLAVCFELLPDAAAADCRAVVAALLDGAAAPA